METTTSTSPSPCYYGPQAPQGEYQPIAKEDLSSLNHRFSGFKGRKTATRADISTAAKSRIRSDLNRRGHQARPETTRGNRLSTSSLENRRISKASKSDKRVQKALNNFIKGLYFHGTSKESAKNIADAGMQVSGKTSGCMDMLKKSHRLDDKAAQRFNYVMSSRSAANYAKMHESATIIGLYIADDIQLEKDPEGYNLDEMRTTQSIPKKHIFRRKDVKDGIFKDQSDAIKTTVGKHLTKGENKILVRKAEEYLVEVLTTAKEHVKKAVSFTEMEEARNRYTLSKLVKSGIDLSTLKEGQEITVSLDSE